MVATLPQQEVLAQCSDTPALDRMEAPAREDALPTLLTAWSEHLVSQNEMLAGLQFGRKIRLNERAGSAVAGNMALGVACPAHRWAANEKFPCWRLQTSSAKTKSYFVGSDFPDHNIQIRGQAYKREVQKSSLFGPAPTVSALHGGEIGSSVEPTSSHGSANMEPIGQ